MVISKQIAFGAKVNFRQVFGFSRLINKSVLKWFLLIMCKQPVLSEDPPFLVETMPYCFGVRREDQQMPPDVFYQKISQYLQENTCVEVSFK